MSVPPRKLIKTGGCIVFDRPAKISHGETGGANERKKLVDHVSRRCQAEVVRAVGPYNINEIYSYFVEGLDADKRFIDNNFARTSYVESFVLPRPDLTDEKKIEIIKAARDFTLCNILTKLYNKFKMNHETTSLEDFLRANVNQAMRDHLEIMLQRDLAEQESTPPMSPTVKKNTTRTIIV